MTGEYDVCCHAAFDVPEMLEPAKFKKVVSTNLVAIAVSVVVVVAGHREATLCGQISSMWDVEIAF